MANIITPKPESQINLVIIGAGADGQAITSVYNSRERQPRGSKYDYHITLIDRNGYRINLLKELQKGNVSLEELKKDARSRNMAFYNFDRQEARERINLVAAEKDSLAAIIDDTIMDAKRSPDYLLLSVPSTSLREVCNEISPLLPYGIVSIARTKGAELREEENHLVVRFPYQIMKEEFAGRGIIKMAAAGFNLYTHVLEGQPQYTVLSTGIKKLKKSEEQSKKSRDEVMQKAIAELSAYNYGITDLHHLQTPQIASMVKPIIAMNSGLLEGYALRTGIKLYDGINVRSNLITGFMNNFLPLAYYLGANTLDWFRSPDSVADISGTAMSRDSRNYMAGKLVGEGVPLKEIQERIGQTVEGLNQLEILMKIIEFHPCFDPAGLVQATHSVFHGKEDPAEAIEKILHIQGKDYVPHRKMLHYIYTLGPFKDRKGISRPKRIPLHRLTFQELFQKYLGQEKD